MRQIVLSLQTSLPPNIRPNFYTANKNLICTPFRYVQQLETVILFWGKYKLKSWLYTSLLGCYSRVEKRTLAWMFTE
jgi:hypothetical protein